MHTQHLWQTRTTHTPDELFASPQLLWQAACEYFEWCVKNPLPEPDTVGGKERITQKVRAFTLSGLELYLDIESLPRGNDANPDLAQVISRIEKVIYTQKFEAAAAGLLNATIITRDLGLTDNREEGENNFNVVVRD